MLFVPQRTEVDCGIATAAMLLGCSYGQARSLAPRHAAKNDRGLWVKELQKMLLDSSGVEWLSYDPRPHRPMEHHHSTLIAMDGAFALVLKAPGIFNAHWIVVKDAVVYDPAHCRPRPIASYPRRRWNLLRILAPAESPRPTRAIR